MEEILQSIAIDDPTRRVYVANNDDDTVSVIDENNYKNITKIPVGKNPSAIANDDLTRNIYVANQGDDTVSVIDENNYKNITKIPVGKNPSAIANDDLTRNIYVANQGDNSISIIDNYAIKILAGILFNVQPPNSGNIVCKNFPFPMPINLYGYVFSGDTCIAKPNKGYEFQSWMLHSNGNHSQSLKGSNLTPINIYDYIASFLDLTENFFNITNGVNIYKYLHMQSPVDKATINITQFGNFTANFKALPPPLPPEFLTTIFSFAVTTVLGSWLIPPFVRWIKSKADVKNLNNYHKKISMIYNDGKMDDKDIKYLDELKNSISDTYAKGKLNEAQFTNLKKEISIHYGEIYKKRIDNLNDLSKEEKEKQINQLQDEIDDVYSKEKITELQYNIIQKRLANLK